MSITYMNLVPRILMRLVLLAGAALALAAQDKPHPIDGGFALPNGWRITPLGKSIPTEDLVLDALVSRDGRSVVTVHAGYNPHGLMVIDAKSETAVQQVPLETAWHGMAWSPDGRKLYVSGGNATGKRTNYRAPIHIFDYHDGKLSDKPTGKLEETIDAREIYWSGMVHHPRRNLLFAVDMGTGFKSGAVVVFDTASGKLLQRIGVEMSPYGAALSADGSRLYVSNWASQSVSVIDTEAMKVMATITVGPNPNAMELGPNGRLYVSCANDNSVVVVDTKSRRVVERISTSLTPAAPEGSTPNALALDAPHQRLYAANADNNDVAVINIKEAGHSQVLGFVPVGWYPSALALVNDGKKLYVANSKGRQSYNDLRGPGSPLASKWYGDETIKTQQKGDVEIVDVANIAKELPAWTKQVYANTPYRDEQLTEAAAKPVESIVPREVGAGSPIHHVLYIIKENRTYDQVFGDVTKGNGDPRLTIFGRQVTPNQHALAESFVLFDSLYCDGEVSEDGHSWSNSAYATDYNEKLWPATYGGQSNAGRTMAFMPSGGTLWDLARRKGLTYRSYGEYAIRASEGAPMTAAPGANVLLGHVSADFKRESPGVRDTDNAKVFIREFDEYEKHFDSGNPELRLPNLIVMSLPENHTKGTAPGAYTPQAMVASNDLAVGRIVDRVTHSKYWPETAIFIIEDDAQDGPDHVDSRRTAALAISPYIRRGTVDSTQYTTSSMLRTIELLLGFPPMSQYDAAAMPMYRAFGVTPDLTAFDVRPAEIDMDAKNTPKTYGARASSHMDFRDVDRAPAQLLNEILWKSIKGADSPLPPPVRRYSFGAEQ
jgi:YVTN family beta-propeller protein